MKTINPVNIFYTVIIVLLLTPVNSVASIFGGELTYVCVSDSTYRFFFKLYNNCDGVAANTTYDLCVYNSCNTSNNFTIPMSKWTGTLPGGDPNGTPLVSSCPGYPTRCQNLSSTIPNYEEWIYSTVLTLNSRCNAWRFSVNINTRPGSNNLNSGNFYVEAILNNQYFQGNSSPFFSIQPQPNNCINIAYNYNNGALDTNNDSLYTEIVNPLTANICSVNPNNISFQSSSPAYSIPGNPFQTNNTFSLNPLSGKISYTPTLSGANTITIRTKEFRNDTLVGSVMRDVQIQVLNGCSAPSVSLNPVVNTFSGGGYTNNTVYTCISQTLNFCFDIKTVVGGTLLATDNHSLSIPAANINYVNQKTDSVRGCMSWTPTLNDTGYKYLIFTVTDSSCASPGVMSSSIFTVPIFIYPPVTALKDTSICPKTPMQLRALGGGSTSNFSWNTLPGGSGVSSLSCNNCNNPIAIPAITTHYIATSNSPYCISSDTVVITTLHAPVFTPLKDTTTCPNTAVSLNLQPLPPTGVSYSYQWTPTNYLSNATIFNPIANPPTDTTYTIVISTNNSPCKQYDTVNIKVLDGFTIHNKDTAICIEESINMNATGDINYSYKWTSSSPSTTIIVPNDTILNPFITPQGLGTVTLYLTGKYPGCLDSIASIKVDVQPYPDVSAGNNMSLCLGKKVKLSAGVNPTDYPFTFSWTPSTNLDSPNIVNPLFTANTLGQNILILKARSSAGCSDSDQVTITVNSEELLDINTPDTAICSGDTIQLHMSGNGIKSFVWFPDFHISDPLSYDPYISPTATITYFAWAVDDKSCTDTESITIFVKPKAIIELPDSVSVFPGQAYTMDPLGNCLYFSWFPKAGLTNGSTANPKVMPDSTSWYYVNGMTEFGCTTNDSIKLLLQPNSKINVPNAFSPNGRNKIIKPAYIGIVGLKKFTIYNRWGMKVFESTNINEGWDGKLNGEMQPMDVYIYTIEATTAKGNMFSQQGNITLIR